MDNVVSIDKQQMSQADVIKKIKSVIGHRLVSVPELAIQIEVSKSTLYLVIGGKYKSNPEGVIRKIYFWLKKEGSYDKELLEVLEKFEESGKRFEQLRERNQF
ncbi:hypothetical protein [Vibrio parahaemolyticus]|uniref:hypothetical protein n=1 Tax=Vibrio parahaemolyticus TaxID=670 RepID=UPI00132EEEBA|nr:hypothetical protein [Vibrio parahaemolyticus]MBE3696774.1 hypothetical protein [Vibrio parahaemolyticus]MBE3775911.1 hypothetical protein [Vibrio parahaemolyticus]QHH01509.1 hypothetical protein EHC64_20700 [Vibrio parahaemolyticus]QHH06622.1 hypothetical protein EHC66_20295 [Vibrio parahaemolyticus]HAS6639293.1 hypothetical protein [Vibrio parahaemolyticus]